ncbi:MAG: cellulose binding domain-containing protein, partial [Planctomycetia bacterium]|nr:cellulose binding domain-containing protein [Planctomycetia bacterium]
MRYIPDWFIGGDSRRRNEEQPSTARQRHRTLSIERLETRALMTASVTPVYAVTNAWNSGFQADLRLESHQAASISAWRLEFDMAANITSIWNAKVVSHTGNHYTVVGETWDSTLPANGSVDFGFVASGAASAKPTN